MRGVRPPRRSGQTWATFLATHVHDIWACDFLPVVDAGFRALYAFDIVEVGSRRVVHVSVTRHPTDAWVAQQLREATPFGITPRFLIRDNDAKFGAHFDRVAVTTRIAVRRGVVGEGELVEGSGPSAHVGQGEAGADALVLQFATIAETVAAAVARSS